MQKILSLTLISAISLCFVVTRYNTAEDSKLMTQNDFVDNNDIIDTPDFSKIDNLSDRKQAFINFLEPSITQVESDICFARYYIKRNQDIFTKTGQTDYSNSLILNSILKTYKIEINYPLTIDKFRQFLVQVNLIPRSLLLSQAALETNWGTSRFSREGLNFFGQHCYTNNCGIYAKKAKDIQLTKFTTAKDSIYSYVTTLNNSPKFTEFRRERNSLWLETSKMTTTPKIIW